MDSGREPSLTSVSEWDYPFTQEQLDAIEAAFDHAAESSSSSIKRRRSGPDGDEVRSNSRRLPSTLIGCQQPAAFRREHRQSRDGASEAENCSVEDSDSVTGSSCPRNPHSNPVPSAYQVNLKVRQPTMTFGGHIVYSRTVPEVEKATMELLEMIEAKKKNTDQVTLGFDIEWRPTFHRGNTPRKAAVMQICGDTSHCYVMHIIHSGIPPILKSLLEDSASLKVGVCIANDAVKILKDYNVCVKDLGELSSLANLKLGGIPRKWSLSALTETLTCKELEKPKKIRLGNWEADVLSREKLQYAATDAFVSWYLYQVLKSFPDVAENQNADEVNGVQS